MATVDEVIADYVARPPASLRQALAKVEQGAKKAAGSLEELLEAARHAAEGADAGAARDGEAKKDAAKEEAKPKEPTLIEKNLDKFTATLESKLGEAFEKIVIQGEKAGDVLKSAFAELKTLAFNDLLVAPLKDLYENSIKAPMQEMVKGLAKDALGWLKDTALKGLKGLGLDLDSLFGEGSGFDLKAILGEGFRGMSDFFKNTIAALGNGIGSIADDLAKGLGSMLSSAGSLLGNALGSLGGLDFGGILAGIGSFLGFAGGGRPPVGVPSIVGERGPELFVPHVAGTIIPNHRLGRSGAAPVVVNQTIQVSAGVAQTVRAEMLSLMPRLRAEAVQAVNEARLRAALPA